MKLSLGQTAPEFSTTDVYGKQISLKDFQGRKLLLAFQRNAACPFCSYQLFRLNKIYPQLQEKGLEVLVFFESQAEAILKSSFLTDQKLTIISDPKRKIYTQYGAEITADKIEKVFAIPSRMEDLQASQALKLASTEKEDGVNQAALPAAFLLDEKAIIRHIHYGQDLGDNIPLDAVSAFANQK
ncbi:peroxiredoxin family protein [Xanthocytophaga agilis]|uniref:Peroxiredoxin family protein n=1 Tax=Xanthocytophaga agilis TaxID=3048010 RepID=A0AAE3UFJ0_9BACT|nr:peroxiredoxin family protein [Xanthocytophaga agilis]MDJ1503310.1 peroxiredoxin family protein [Xanthocytophaga agilis]